MKTIYITPYVPKKLKQLNKTAAAGLFIKIAEVWQSVPNDKERHKTMTTWTLTPPEELFLAMFPSKIIGSYLYIQRAASSYYTRDVVDHWIEDALRVKHSNLLLELGFIKFVGRKIIFPLVGRIFIPDPAPKTQASKRANKTRTTKG